MNEAPEILRRKFLQLFGWEKRKRRQEILTTLLCYSLLAALLLLPIYFLLPVSFLRWFIPLPIFLMLAPFSFVARRWRREDSARALADLDNALHSDERAITAWELIEAKEHRPAALLVLKQAAERLKTVDPKALFHRSRRWQDYAVIPLLLVWGGLLWIDVDLRLRPDAHAPAQQGLAQKLRQFSRELQEKAGSEGLRQSLQVGRELEKTAQKSIEAKIADEQFKSELTGMSSKVEGMGKSMGNEPSFATSESRESLKDLKAELEAAQELLNLPDGAKGERGLGQSSLERLATLPQLKRQLDQQGQANRSLSQNELKSFLDSMDKQVTGELDRRTLLDAQQFLEQLAKQEPGEKAESNARVAGRGEQDLPGEGEKAKTNSNRPGSEPGTKEEIQPAPQLPAAAATQLKGMIGQGNSSGVALKGKPSAGKTEVPQEEVIATYQRQAEQELNTERVPEALKETIRRYFLSLETKQRSDDPGK
jgi:hypothetical protein